MNALRSVAANPLVKRLVSCLALGVLLAVIIGPQEGTREDYGLAFHDAVLNPRIVVFLLIGVAVFLAITFWPRISPFLGRPGVRPLTVGAVTVLAGYYLLRWSDDGRIPDGKLATLAPLAGDTSDLAPLARTFFAGNLYWFLFLIVFVLAGAAIILRRPVVAWVVTGLSALVGVWAYVAHNAVQSLLATPDHSTGAAVTLLGYLTIAVSAAAVALSKSETAQTSVVVSRVLGWRPGFPIAVLGVVAGVEAFAQATWFSPLNLNRTFLQLRDLFDGQGLAPLAFSYLVWLGWVLLVVNLVLGLAATYLRNRLLGWVTAGVGLVSVVITLSTMYAMSALGAEKGQDSATGPWQNLGSGPWLACLAFCLTAGAGIVVASLELRRNGRPVSSDVLGTSGIRAPGSQRTLILVVLALALFVPPTLTEFWQKVLVSEIGVYVLLAIGLNVVVGWAGLLDLGYIAFYAIGSYTTAYLVGSLPHKPPFTLSPLWAIPFAIAVCLIAGVALGAPTLRLRGDYLAIVTLGFGEIIRIAAINNPGDITNSTRGPSPSVPHPVIAIGPIRIEWGLNNLQYWYLLLVLVLIVVVLFTRLERSRLGRSWAAIREDEVAAQATGINTTRVKLLAFAIGASTSGVAGVFFASQVGYFNPDNFVLNNSILVVAYVVFGGMGSLPGAMAGAAVLTWMPEFLRDQVPAEDRQLWIGLVILLMMIFRPAGLIPARRRAAELHGLDNSAAPDTTAVPAGEGMGGTR